MPRPARGATGRPEALARDLLIAGAYLAGLALLVRLAPAVRPGAGPAPFNPAAGLGLALLVGVGVRFIPVVFLATLVPGLGVDPGPGPVGSDLLDLIAPAVSYGLAAAALRHLVPIDPALSRVRDAGLLAAAALAAPLAVAATAVALDVSAGATTWFDAPRAVADRWIGDAIGAVTVAPPLLIWGRSPRRPPDLRATVRGLAQAALIGAAAVLAILPGFLVDENLMFLGFPPLILAALRHGLTAATFGVAALNFAAGWAGQGGDHLASLQVFMLSLAVTGLFLGAVVDSRNRALEALRRANEHLEARVAARTTELRASNERLSALAATDALTGLANRRALHEALESAAALAARQGLPVSVALFDVDHFKSYNDTFGHPAGDRALVAVAGVLRAQARSCDLVARLGGEEFAAVLPAADAPDALAFAERVRDAVSAYPWSQRRVTISIGVATCPAPAPSDPRPDPLELIAQADRALYHSKRSGRDRSTHHDALSQPALAL